MGGQNQQNCHCSSLELPASFFAVLKKSSADQKARIEKKAVEKKEAKKAEEKKAEKKEKQDKLKEAQQTSDDDDTITISGRFD